MPLEGLRAWIGEVERKLGKRTRVFLALCAIAIGIAGAAVYLALDARTDSVSEGDVQELQRELEAQGVAGAAGGAELSRLEAEVESLQAEVERLKGDGGADDATQNNDSTQKKGDATQEEGNGKDADLQKLLEEAKRRSEESE